MVPARASHKGNSSTGGEAVRAQWISNSREAWIELQKIYGGKEIKEWPKQLHAFDGKVREARCSGGSDIPDFLVRLDGMWIEFGFLGDPTSDYVKRAALLFGVRNAPPPPL